MVSRSTGFMIDTKIYNKINLNNLEILREIVSTSDINDDYQIIFQNYEMKDIVDDFFVTFFNNDNRLLFNKFLRKATISNAYTENAEISGCCFKKQIHHINIPPITSQINATTNIHEFMHYYNIIKLPKLFYDSNYSEVLSILTELLFSDFCDKYVLFIENLCLKNNLIFRLTNDFISSKNLVQISEEELQKEENIERLIYMISSTCAINLLCYFKEDPKIGLKKYQAIINGGVCIEDVLEYYNISISNDKTIDTIKNLTRKLQQK